MQDDADSMEPGSPSTSITIPTYSAASLLLQNYEANIDYMCPIIHNPTTRSLMKTFYVRVSQSEPVPLGQAAIFLSMFSLSTFFYQPFHNSEVVTTERGVFQLSKYWSKRALDLLDKSQRNGSGTVEDIQAYIMLSYVAMHLDGISARGRHLITSALSLARDLRLHRLDVYSSYPSTGHTGSHELINLEMKRRIIWHIISMDW